MISQREVQTTSISGYILRAAPPAVTSPQPFLKHYFFILNTDKCANDLQSEDEHFSV